MDVTTRHQMRRCPSTTSNYVTKGRRKREKKKEERRRRVKAGRVEDGGPESGKRVDGGTEKRELPLPWAPRSGNHWEGIGGRIKRERRVSKKRGSMIGVGSDRNREDEGKAAHQTRQLPLAPLFIPLELRISQCLQSLFRPFLIVRPFVPPSLSRISHTLLYCLSSLSCISSDIFRGSFSLSHCSKERAISHRQS